VISQTEQEGDQTVIDLGSVLPERVARLQAEYPTAEIRTSIPETAPVVAHELLPYAYDNVLENALEHNDARTPRLEIDVSEETNDQHNSLTVRIEDNGPGLPETEREVLRSESETPLSHSSGMRLWLTRWIVRSSKGDLGRWISLNVDMVSSVKSVRSESYESAEGNNSYVPRSSSRTVCIETASLNFWWTKLRAPSLAAKFSRRPRYVWRSQ